MRHVDLQEVFPDQTPYYHPVKFMAFLSMVFIFPAAQ